MNPNETGDCIYLNLQCMNPSQTNSNSIQAVINQKCNPIVKNLGDYNVYLQSMTLTTSDLPFMNMYRFISWDPNNFLTNKTNMCVSFTAPAGQYPFIIGAPTATLYGINPDATEPTHYNTVVSFVTFFSENSTLLNPGDAGFTSSENYNRGYFNVHSIQLFLQYINNAINAALNTITGTPYNNSMYFYYPPDSQIYGLKVPDAVKTEYTFCANSFCEKFIDAFRWKFLGNSDLTQPNYIGQDYQFVWDNYPFNKDADNVWTYTAEYNTVSALCDTHSIIITTPNGSLSTLRQQYLPATVDMRNNINLPMVPALKNIDIDFTSLQFSTINNSFIQYESSGPFFPVNGLTNEELNNINIVINIMTIDNILYPVNIPAGGYANVKFVLCKKKKEKK